MRRIDVGWARMANNLLPLVGAIVLAGLAAAAVLVVIAVRASRRRDAHNADKQLLELARLQAETAVRIETMREMLARRQPHLHPPLTHRLTSLPPHLHP